MTLPPQQEFDAAIAARREWAVSTLARLARHGSILGNEAPAQHDVAGIYEAELGLATKVIPIDHDKIRQLPGYSPVDWTYAGRPNVVGVHNPGNSKGRSLVFNGHIDVVSPEPVKLWSTPPFEPAMFTDADGLWMRGRGAGDMKAGNVCYMWALAALRDMGMEPASRVICQSVIEEECTGNGALALCADGYTGDACLIPEPFNQTVLLRQVGVMWFQVRILGKTTHVLGAGRGVNAIEKSFVVIRGLRELEEELNRPKNIPPSYRGVDHPINLNVGIINGGDWASTVAGECVTRFRLGLFPGQRLDDLKAKIETAVARAAQSDPWLKDFPPTVEYVGFQAEGCEFNSGGAFGQALSAAHRGRNGADPSPLVATCTTDVRYFELYYNTPCTCYGPRAKDIHGADESVSIESMQRTTAVMIDLIAGWCKLRKRS